MKHLLIAAFLLPFTGIAQNTHLSLNCGASLITPQNNKKIIQERNLQPTISLEVVRHTKGLFYYGAQLGYSPIAGRYVGNDPLNQYGFTGKYPIINYYGRHSLNLSLTGGVSFGKGNSLISIGGNVGGVYSFSGYDIYTQRVKGDRLLHYHPYSIGTLYGLKAGYSLQVARRVMVGVSAEPQRVTIRYKNNSNASHFNRLLFTVGIHYTL